ncbi:uncharacterized protein LOC134438300 [Engraulis encrasicolus]|uniref:uncharacterized protein LOC134438300 n=1 Tax=Engraulis encrasicolus TaxID=184585 RepID=UPI002FD70F92
MAVCEHSLPDHHIQRFTWLKDKKSRHEKTSNLTLEKVLHPFTLTCTIHSHCGNFTSGPILFDVNDNSILVIVLCGGIAVLLLVAFAVGMKCLLRRDMAQRQSRQRKQAQNISTIHTTTSEVN